MILRYIFYLSGLIFISIPFLSAQTTYKRLAFEPVTGVAFPQTDAPAKLTPLYGANLIYSLSSTLSVNFNYSYSLLKSGADKKGGGRIFQDNFYLAGVRFQIHPGGRFTRTVNPYFSLGMSIMHMAVSKIRAHDKDPKVAVANDYIGFANGFPIGLGAKIYLNRLLDLNFCLEYILTNTDSVDGYSLQLHTGKYNSQNKPDFIVYFSAGLAVKFGLGKKSKGQQHIDWISEKENAARERQEILQREMYSEQRIDSLGKVIRKLSTHQGQIDSMLSKYYFPIQLNDSNGIKINDSLPKDTLKRNDSIVKDTMLKVTIPEVQTSSVVISTDTLLVQKLYHITDSLEREIGEMNKKINFFLLGYIPKFGSTRTTMDLELRQGVPNTYTSIVKIIPKGTEVEYTGFVNRGELINGNPNWYKDSFGNYFPAGGTEHPFPQGEPK